MSERTAGKPRVLHLAELIEQDIAARGLKPGDAYLGTSETARMLKVNTTHANKALQLLVQRRRLLRKQRLGTFVADPGAAADRPLLHCIHLLVHQNYLRTEGVLADGVIIGMQQEMPGVNVRFNFMPAQDDAAAAGQLIAAAMRSPQPEGFVLVRSSLTMQRLLAHSGLPTVVFGTLHPSVTRLSCIDRDQRVIGRLVAGHVAARRHRRVLILGRDRVLPGDHLFLDGIRETLASAGLPASAVVTRFLPADGEAIAAEVAAVLSAMGEPAGIIARSEPLADGAATGAGRVAKRIGRKVDIIVSDLYRRGGEKPPRFAHVQSLLTPEEIGRRLGRMLANQAKHPSLPAETEIIPVAIHEPAT